MTHVLMQHFNRAGGVYIYRVTKCLKQLHKKQMEGDTNSLESISIAFIGEKMSCLTTIPVSICYENNLPEYYLTQDTV